MRTARFTVPGHFGCAPSATVEIVETDKTITLRVRPLRSREVAEIPLAEVAHFVLARDAKHRSLRAPSTMRPAVPRRRPLHPR